MPEKYGMYGHPPSTETSTGFISHSVVLQRYPMTVTHFPCGFRKPKFVCGFAVVSHLFSVPRSCSHPYTDGHKQSKTRVGQISQESENGYTGEQRGNEIPDCDLAREPE